MKVSDILVERMHDGSITAYHGSDERFSSFDPDRVKSASGADKGGWGFYFSTSKDVASQYASGTGEVRKYRIPSGPWFNFGQGLDAGVGSEILDELESRNVSEEDLEEFRTDFLDDQYIGDTTNEQVYDWLGHVLGSRREASEFLKYLGYAGNKYRDKTDPSATNYVVFDPRDIHA